LLSIQIAAIVVRLTCENSLIVFYNAGMCMEREGELPAEALLDDKNFRERVEHFAEELVQNPAMTRRALLGLGALTVFEAGIAAAMAKSSHTKDAANVAASGLQFIRNRSATTTSSTSTTTTSTTSTTTTLPPPPTSQPLPEGRVHAAAVEINIDELSTPQRAERIRAMIGFMPGLHELSKQHPTTAYFQNLPEKMSLLDRIRRESDVEVGEYHNTVVNETRVGAFRRHGDYGTRITPRLTVVHWTAEFYENGVDQMIKGMIGRGVNYHYAVDRISDGKTQTYRFFDEDFPRQGAHAFRANQLGRGISIMAARLEDIHPLQVKEVIKTIVRDHRRHNLPIEHATVVSHFATDLILNNVTFDPATRTAESFGKFDVPQELMDIIVQKAQALDAALGPR
jgi:hypothetical protein